MYTPHVVEQILDDEGNIVSQHDSTPVRQVISEETSDKVRQCLEYVVAKGTGKNGQVAGYRIGGKTGTADKTGTGDVVLSWMAFSTSARSWMFTKVAVMPKLGSVCSSRL